LLLSGQLAPPYLVVGGGGEGALEQIGGGVGGGVGGGNARVGRLRQRRGFVLGGGLQRRALSGLQRCTVGRKLVPENGLLLLDLGPARYCSPRHPSHSEHSFLKLNSVSDLVSNLWYRIPFDQSELSISRIPPTRSPTVRPVRHLE